MSSTLKRDRAVYENEQLQIQNDSSRLHFTRVKDVGTKNEPGEQRNRRIVEIAEQLPAGNRLRARSVYWFVTSEAVQLSYEDTKLFLWQESIEYTEGDRSFHLNQVNFVRNKRGVITFMYPDGFRVYVICESTNSTSASKKPRLLPQHPVASRNTNAWLGYPLFIAEDKGVSTEQAMIIDESESAIYSAVGTPQLDASGNNTNQYFNPASTAVTPSPPSSSFSQSPECLLDYELLPQHTQNSPQPLSPQEKLPPGTPLIINILLLVPDKKEFTQTVNQALQTLDFAHEASCTEQCLYKQNNLSNTSRHVLLFPYEKLSSLYIIKDYLPQTSEVILLLENEMQQNDFMAISKFINVPQANIWPFAHRAASFGTVQIDYATLHPSVKQMLAIGELRDVVLGGASCRRNINNNNLTEAFTSYFLEWTLAKAKQPFVSQNIYLCFRFKPEKIKAFSDYAVASLHALGIDYEPVVVYGSVLVYLRCPSYVTWHILQLKEKIFQDLRQYDLTEICECFISDIDASMQRPENKEFIDELEHFKEQMICDNVAELPTSNKFRVSLLDFALRAFSAVGTKMGEAVAYAGPVEDDYDEMIIEPEPVILPPTIGGLPTDKRNVLEAKCTEMNKFDNKWLRTTEDCYNSDRLRQQLFNFKTDKNAKFAVRVFISSASAGMATNVAKLMRQFNGKSIVDGVHSGLQIANTIVEWNQSGLVHIGELKHTSATAVLFDVQESVRFDFNDEIANKIINFIQRWNVEHQYSSKEYNSHRFVRDFLQETLNVSLVERFKGPLGLYMDHVMKTGDSTPRLISKSHGTMVFKTHQELEEAEKQIRSKLSDDEIKLLKIFHRGFQLQEAAHGKDVSSCCYGLPTNGLEILNDSGKPMKY